ncbi:MAG: DUF2231 domain-containing protein [Chloroflexota bacterium]
MTTFPSRPGADPEATDHASRAAIAGHPLHPAVVPLSIGSTVLAFATDLVAARTRDRTWAHGARWLLRSAAVGGLLAAPLGWIDLLAVPAARRQPWAWVHGLGNAGVLALTLAEVLRRRGPVRASEASPSVTGLAVGMLTVTGWLGGELSYRYRIGVAPQARGSAGGPGPGVGAPVHRPLVAVPVRADPAIDGGGGGTGWAMAAVERADGPVEEGIRDEDALRHEAEQRLPRDGDVPGSSVSADPVLVGRILPAAGGATPDIPRTSLPARGEGALDPAVADAIARDLARGVEPAEGRDPMDDDRPWGAGRNL